MSDRDDMVPDTGYGTLVPGLDDHRNQSSSSQRAERPRRGTFDSLYGARQLDTDPVTPAIRVRDFEEAVIDEDGLEAPVATRHARRPTVETANDGRSVSPPNSVKAFAQARRRERDMSFSEPKCEHEDVLGRTLSVSSRRSHRSKPRTIDNDSASLMTDKEVEGDVCFPLQHGHRNHELRIDFDYLESFVNAERAARVDSRETAAPSVPFEDLRAQSTDNRRIQLTTIDGDIVDMPSEVSMSNEKECTASTVKPVQPHHVDKNRFSFFSSAWESTIHAAEFGDLVLPGEDIRGLFELPEDEADGVWWLNVNRATKEEVHGICKAFGVHPLTIEDIITQEAREKIELFPSYYFACFRSFNVVEESDGIEYEPFNIYVLVFREGTLSFSFAPNSHASQVRKRITALKEYVSLSSDWICYALMYAHLQAVGAIVTLLADISAKHSDNIVDCFAPVIRTIELEADAIEDEVFVMRQDDSSSFLRSIGRVRKNCMALLRLLGGKADVLRGFTKRCNENYQVTPHMDIGMYLGDIQDHVVTMATNLGHFEKMLSRAHSNYLATLSINSISQGTDTNRVLSKITFLASVLVPLNLVSGVFGMNVSVPFQDSGRLEPFFGIIGCMILICSIILGLARWKRYI